MNGKILTKVNYYFSNSLRYEAIYVYNHLDPCHRSKANLFWFYLFWSFSSFSDSFWWSFSAEREDLKWNLLCKHQADPDTSTLTVNLILSRRKWREWGLSWREFQSNWTARNGGTSIFSGRTTEGASVICRYRSKHSQIFFDDQ